MFRAFLLWFLLAAFLPQPALAMQDPDSEDDVELGAMFSITASENGDAVVFFYSTNHEKEISPPTVELLARTLHCEARARTSMKKVSVASYECKQFLKWVDGRLRASITLPLVLEYLRASGEESVILSVQLPYEAGGDPPIDSRYRRYNRNIAFYSFSVAKPPAETIEIYSGIVRSRMYGSAAFLMTLLLLPVSITLTARRWALRQLAVQGADRPAVWFSYWRVQELLGLVSFWVWWSATEITKLQSLLAFALGALFSVNLTEAFDGWFFWYAFVFGPAAASTVCCAVLSFPVRKHMRATDWTRNDILRQSILAQIIFILPVCMGVQGIGMIADDNGTIGTVLVGAAVVLFFVLARMLARATDMTPHALTAGTLRDRVFEMARRANVPLQQLYVLPMGKGRMANAFAAKGNLVMLSSYLLQNLSKREVDAVVAHELTHLKKKHVASLGAISAVFLVGVIFFGGYGNIDIGASGALPLLPFVVLAFILVQRMVSRRFEWQADAGAVQITGDPEAMITGLVKISRLSMLPIRWSRAHESTLTHPSMARRAEAIAKAGQISAARLEALLQTQLGDQEVYEVPPSARGEKAFSTTHKGNVGFKVFGMIAITCAVAPALFAKVVEMENWGGVAALVALAAGLLITFAAYVWGCNPVPSFGAKELWQRLTASLARDGIQAEAWKGIPIALAPDRSPRLYEGNFAWDVGYLFLFQNQLCYVGEETRFALHRSTLRGVTLDASTPSWIRSRWIVLECEQADPARRVAFRIRKDAVSSIRVIDRETAALQATLQNYCIGNGAEFPASLPPELQKLADFPSFGEVTSMHPRTFASPKIIFKNVYIMTLLGMFAGILLGLPFHLWDWVLQLDRKVSSIGLGYYPIAVSFLMGFVQLIPYFRYKDPER